MVFMKKVEPESKADVRKRFTAVIKDDTKSGKAQEDALRNKAAVTQHNVSKNGWNGDIFDIANLGKPWSRTENETDLVNAIKAPKSPGVAGDVISSVLQGEWLSVQERAFRSRHITKARAAAHAASRRRGHGHENGLFNKGIVNYIKNIVKLSKDKR